MNAGGGIQNVCNSALTGCCLSGCCHHKNFGKTIQGSMEVSSGNAQPSMLSDNSCQHQPSEMKPYESGFVEPHFYSEVELQVELYSWGCCNEDEPCLHGYGYKELDVDDLLDEQSTIYLIDEHEECDDRLIDNRQMDNPVKLSKTQKKNLKK